MTPPTHCPLKLTTVPASLCIVSLLTSPAAALRQDRYDLASLILESYAVILAERGPQRPLKNWAAATSYTVRKVYRGGMIPGQKIEVFGHTREDPAKGLPLYYDGANTMAVDREAILVVGEWNPSTSGMQSWLPKDTPSLTIITERFLSRGHVYRFDDRCLEPQGRDPQDAADAWSGEPLSLAEFETEIRKAIVKVEKFHRAAKLVNPPDRRKALLALIEPQEDLPELRIEPLARDGYGDSIRQRAMEMFTQWGDLDSALEVAARSEERLGFHFRCPIRSSDLLAAALREDVPPCKRAAAIYLIAREHLTSPSQILRGVQDLLHCHHPEVKQAAAHVLAQAIRIPALNPMQYKEEDSAPLVEALLGAWRQERDPAFRISILCASMGEFSEVLSREDREPDVLFVGRVRGGRAHFMTASVTRQGITLTSLVVVGLLLREKKEYRSHGVDPKESKEMTLWWGSSTGLAGGSFPVQFEPPLPPGRYRMWIEARLARPGNEEFPSTLLQTVPEEAEFGQ